MIDVVDCGVKIERLLDSVLKATGLDLSYQTGLHPGSVPGITVDFAGADTPLLTEREGELLRALEHLGAKVCGLEPAEHDLLRMDAEEFKVKREAALVEWASRAELQVRQTGRPYTFSPMSSHERRRLHLALTGSGLHTESTGAGAQRAVVLYPPGGALDK